ncbi:amastin-like protein [Leishmania tarentolae]|uniref:Amastin-like protein n=1 Tax=Leishmania tarentolae TaxID=5689 RepID=A0A640KRM8_LEITA|nr:amastin-like protein [Leishmania tarentolae]
MRDSCCRFGMVIYFIVQFIAWALIISGGLVDQFRVQSVNVFSNNSCLTIWGFKESCLSGKWTVGTKDYWIGCPERQKRFIWAEGLSIAAIIVSALACVIGFVMLCCCRCLRWFCLLLNILTTVCGCAVTALMIDAYFNNHEGSIQKFNTSCYPLRKNGSVILPIGTTKPTTMASHYKYGVGFAIFTTGWCLCFINIFFLMMPC